MYRFKTSQGSEYEFDDASMKTKRVKRSGGSEQGKVFDWLNVVFIRDKVKLYAGPISVNAYVFDKRRGTLDYFRNDGTDEFDGEVRVLVVAERRRESGDIVSMQRAFQRPEVGLYPFEWGKNEGKSIKHLGNDIVEVDSGVDAIDESLLRALIKGLIGG